VKWIPGASETISECGRYKIKNHGAKYGDGYHLWTLGVAPFEKCFCVLLKTGTRQEIMNYFNGED
jgi:hypothetical protein